MFDCHREQLLDYLLGAMDDSERHQIEKQLAENLRLRKELALVRLELEPLRPLRQARDVPFGLAARTCEFVFSHADGATEPAETVRIEMASAPAGPRLRPVQAPSPGAVAGRWTWADISVAAGILVAATLLVFPALAKSRFGSRVLACQNNLRQIGIALDQYSQNNNGYFPAVLPQGPLAYAGSYAPILQQNGYLDGGAWIWCPGSPAPPSNRGAPPTVAELWAAGNRHVFERLRCQMGGDYAYSIGFLQGDRYHGPVNLRRQDFPVLADVPSPHLPGSGSLSHGGRGQNVLCEDQHVVFLVLPHPAGRQDNIYVNNFGLVAPGRGRDDAVLGASAVPISFSIDGTR